MHAWRAVACQWRDACSEANGWKLIAARLTIHLSKGPYRQWGTSFGCQNWFSRLILATKFSLGRPVLAKFLPKSVRGITFGGTDFGLTGLSTL